MSYFPNTFNIISIPSVLYATTLTITHTHTHTHILPLQLQDCVTLTLTYKGKPKSKGNLFFPQIMKKEIHKNFSIILQHTPCASPVTTWCYTLLTAVQATMCPAVPEATCCALLLSLHHHLKLTTAHTMVCPPIFLPESTAWPTPSTTAEIVAWP